MAIKYEIMTIENADGNGGRHKFVRLSQPNMMTAEQMGRYIESSCTLTRADVDGMMAALRSILVRELGQGNRVYLPSIGYFRLSGRLEKPEKDSKQAITAKDIRLKGIVFRPEQGLIAEVSQRASFEKADSTSQSVKYEEAELWPKIEAYIKQNHHITTSDLRRMGGLSNYMANKWLKFFTNQGRLLKTGSPKLAIYYLP